MTKFTKADKQLLKEFQSAIKEDIGYVEKSRKESIAFQEKRTMMRIASEHHDTTKVYVVENGQMKQIMPFGDIELCKQGEKYADLQVKYITSQEKTYRFLHNLDLDKSIKHYKKFLVRSQEYLDALMFEGEKFVFEGNPNGEGATSGENAILHYANFIQELKKKFITLIAYAHDLKEGYCWRDEFGVMKCDKVNGGKFREGIAW